MSPHDVAIHTAKETLGEARQLAARARAHATPDVEP